MFKFIYYKNINTNFKNYIYSREKFNEKLEPNVSCTTF